MSSKIKMFTVPNALTLCNLMCGCVATSYAFYLNANVAFWFIAAAAVFDLLDGAAARLLGQHSEMGKQLDSLADIVSFGVAPAALLYSRFGAAGSAIGVPDALGWATFAVALFSALRLAKFNIDDSQTEDFAGMPTPAAALAVASLSTWEWSISREWLLVLAAAICVLLVCPMRMFSLKFKHLAWHGNELRYTFLGAVAVIVAVLKMQGVAAAIGLYVVLSAACYKK